MDRFERIKAYVDGTLSIEDVRQFKTALDQDEELAIDVSLYRLEKDMANVLIEDDIKEKTKQWKIPPIEAEVKKIPFTRRWRVPLSIAASFLLLTGAFSWFFIQGNYSNQALVEQSYKEPGLSMTTRDIDGGANPFEQAINAYEAGHYEDAIQSFNSMSQESPLYYDAQYNLAHCYYKAGQSKQAIQIFQLVIDNVSDVKMQQQSEWYLALSYLKDDNLGEDFQKLMNKMVNDSNHRYQSYAKELDNSLKSFWRKLIL